MREILCVGGRGGGGNPLALLLCKRVVNGKEPGISFNVWMVFSGVVYEMLFDSLGLRCTEGNETGMCCSIWFGFMCWCVSGQGSF